MATWKFSSWLQFYYWTVNAIGLEGGSILNFKKVWTWSQGHRPDVRRIIPFLPFFSKLFSRVGFRPPRNFCLFRRKLKILLKKFSNLEIKMRPYEVTIWFWLVVTWSDSSLVISREGRTPNESPWGPSDDGWPFTYDPPKDSKSTKSKLITYYYR